MTDLSVGDVVRTDQRRPLRLPAVAFGLLALLTFCPVAQADGGKAAKAAPARGKVCHVPYQLTDTAHVLVRTKINGKGPYNFIIDTGAPLTFVAAEVGKKLGLKAAKDGWSPLETFDVEGGVRMTKVKVRVETPFQIEGMNAMNFAGVPLHGILGYPELARYRLEFDFSRPKMTWTELAFAPPEPKLLGVKSGEAGGLNALGSVMKLLSMVLGKRPSPELVPGAFFGVELAEGDGPPTVAKVLADSPAAKAGLRPGDTLLKLAAHEVEAADDLRRHTRTATAGQSVVLTVRRDGKEQEITVTPGEGL